MHQTHVIDEVQLTSSKSSCIWIGSKLTFYRGSPLQGEDPLFASPRTRSKLNVLYIVQVSSGDVREKVLVSHITRSIMALSC